MRSDRLISTIDFHTAGIGMRLVTSGLGRLPGSTIADKRHEFQERLDHLTVPILDCKFERCVAGCRIADVNVLLTYQQGIQLFQIILLSGSNQWFRSKPDVCCAALELNNFSDYLDGFSNRLNTESLVDPIIIVVAQHDVGNI